MQNKIAAFAPTSGIQFSEEPWKNCKKPVNMLECIAYGDDVFGYEKYGIHAYIENYALHDNHTQYSKTVGYKPISSSWYDGDLEKWTGGPNGGEVWLYSYNNGGHWPMDLNRHLIWNFCKRFTLNQPKAKIIMPEGETTYLFMGPKSEATYPDITIEATATATSGDIEKVEFYDGTTLIETLTAAPYTATLTAPKTGQHELRVVVTDSNGKKGENSCMVNCVASQTSYNLIQTFTTEGTVPQNWYVCNGKLKRVGGGLPYTSGCRLLHFTNETKAFEYGLMVQNPGGNEKAAWARFGDNAARSHMTLHTGHYALRSRVCNWDQPNLSPVIYTIEDLNGNEVASKTFTPAKNIGGNTANRFTISSITCATEESTGRKIIIENQLEDTNHDHLGKIITYASGKDAEVIIWIVKRARDEHKQAIEWLNNHTDDKCAFFLIEIELWRIGKSEPAVKFNIVERPNDWAKSMKKAASLTQGAALKLDFWQQFIDYNQANNGVYARSMPTTDAWIGKSIKGIPGTSVNLVITKQSCRIEAYQLW